MRKKQLEVASVVKNSSPKPNAIKVKNFKIPKQLFNQINECSHGGYILITLNEEGEPEMHTKFDNSIIALGLNRFAADYFQGVAEIHRHITQQYNGMEEGEDGDEDGMQNGGMPIDR